MENVATGMKSEKIVEMKPNVHHILIPEDYEEEVRLRSAVAVASDCRCAEGESEVHCSQQSGMAWCYVREDSGCPDAATARTMRGLRTWSKVACEAEK